MPQPERVPLDRDKIVAAATQLLDSVGLDGLSTRALATRLGVRSPALYWHFQSKGELVDAIAVAMLQGLSSAVPPDHGVDVATWLIERAQAFRRALLSHRDGARVHAGTTPGPQQMPSLNAQVEVLMRLGMTAGDASRAALAISRYTVGWALEEQAQSHRDRNDHPKMNLQAFPDLEAAREVLEQHDPDEDFTFGLTALVSGLTRQSYPVGRS